MSPGSVFKSSKYRAKKAIASGIPFKKRSFWSKNKRFNKKKKSEERSCEKPSKLIKGETVTSSKRKHSTSNSKHHENHPGTHELLCNGESGSQQIHLFDNQDSFIRTKIPENSKNVKLRFEVKNGLEMEVELEKSICDGGRSLSFSLKRKENSVEPIEKKKRGRKPKIIKDSEIVVEGKNLEFTYANFSNSKNDFETPDNKIPLSSTNKVEISTHQNDAQIVKNIDDENFSLSIPKKSNSKPRVLLEKKLKIEKTTLINKERLSTPSNRIEIEGRSNNSGSTISDKKMFESKLSIRHSEKVRDLLKPRSGIELTTTHLQTICDAYGLKKNGNKSLLLTRIRKAFELRD